jgi:hypothetical protein
VPQRELAHRRQLAPRHAIPAQDLEGEAALDAGGDGG